MLAAVLPHSAGRASTPFEDSMAQRLRPCTQCHGQQGRAAADGYYPRIAGKPVGYLLNQLRNFRDGRRHYALMVAMIDPLSDSYLQQIAEHFAALDLPYPPAARQDASAVQLRRGERLALQGDAARELPACADCHGRQLTGVLPHVPGLLGLPRDYLNAQLGAWRTGQRRAHSPDCMQQVAKRLDGADVAAVSAWLASQQVPNANRAALPATPRLVSGRTLVCGSAPELGGVTQ